MKAENIKTGDVIAVYFNDNSDGQDTRYFVLATVDKDMELRHYETNDKLLQYVGDEVVRWWKLDSHNALYEEFTND